MGFPYLFCDATYVKGRVKGRVVSRAVVVVTGVSATGDREVLGIDVGDSEDGAFWTCGVPIIDPTTDLAVLQARSALASTSRLQKRSVAWPPRFSTFSSDGF